MFGFLLAVLAAVGAAAYVMVGARNELYEITSYQTAAVVQTSFLQLVEGSGEVVIPTRMVITSPEEGYADELYVFEGDSVVVGDLLGSITVPELEDSLEDIEIDLIDARSTLRHTVQQNEIELARMGREFGRLSSAVDDAREEVDRLEALVAINANRRSELDDANDALDDAIDNRDEQAIQIDEEAILNELSVEAQELTIAEYELQQERMRERLRDTTVVSPLTGTVLAVSETISVSGSELEKGEALFTVADPESARVELEVSEKYAAQIVPGQSVALNISGTEFDGTVESVGAIAELASGSLEATVLVTVIAHTDGETLLQGATAAGEFGVGEIADAMTLPRGAYLSTGSQRYVYVVRGGTAVKTEVVFGEIQASQVQIVSGLVPGDEVILSGYQNYIDQETVRLIAVGK